MVTDTIVFVSNAKFAQRDFYLMQLITAMYAVLHCVDIYIYDMTATH